jgi:SAM-dependent methyltransferase
MLVDLTPESSFRLDVSTFGAGSTLPGEMGRSEMKPAAGGILLHGTGTDREVRGWMVDPRDGPYERIEVRVDGARVGEAEPANVPGAGARAAWIPNAAESGFAYRFGEEGDVGGRLELFGHRDGVPAGRLLSLLEGVGGQPPVPPIEIAAPSNGVARRQAAGDPMRTAFWQRGFVSGGLTAAASLLEQVERHAGRPEGKRLLDWGCGCGRVTRHLIGQGFASVSGCDLDATALAWAKENLAGANFFESVPDPPLELDDGSVDVVVGCSVMTHFDVAQQERWLAELRRITAPGGFVLLSTQGEFAYLRSAVRSSRLPARLAARRARSRLSHEGFLDLGATRALEGIAPEGYYRSVAQTPGFTRDLWSAHLEVLEHIECGLDGAQDLVVLRRP